LKKDKTNNQQVLTAWEANANAWIHSLEKNEIKSRLVLTNLAITNAILEVQPKTILDAGCGEGWLGKTMEGHGIKVDGFDGVKVLVDNANKKNNGDYYVLSYHEVRNGKKQLTAMYDAIVFNFALFEKEKVKPLLERLKNQLKPKGFFIIQTISEQNNLFASRSEDGWMLEDWKSMKIKFPAPFKWYYRTDSEWRNLFNEMGASKVIAKQNFHQETKEAFSIIYTIQI